jgi:glycosyltransferase involved in cell wall biosynthesis
MKLEKIYIVTDAPIPIGFAPTNRILSYASGFEENGVECGVVIFRKTENPNRLINKKIKGLIGKSKFIYLFNSTAKSIFFLKRRLDNLFGLFRLFLFSLKIEKNSVVIYYSSYTRYALILWLSKIFKGTIILKEESEHPIVYKQSKNKLGWLFYRLIHYRLFDGFLLMTSNLIMHFKYRFPNKLIAHIPMTVDLNRFKFKYPQAENLELKIITYVGHLNNKKDGMLFLLEAFSSAIKYLKEYKLLVCGYSNNENEIEIFKKTVERLGLKDNIIFNQKVENAKIPEILGMSSVLVLPRPHSLQAQNGFPTKLGEYLASGRPTIITNVGEISKYLIDGESTYISVPGNINSLSDNLIKVISDLKKAEKIGKNGRSIADKYFNNVKQTKKIIDFIQHSF